MGARTKGAYHKKNMQAMQQQNQKLSKNYGIFDTPAYVKDKGNAISPDPLAYQTGMQIASKKFKGQQNNQGKFSSISREQREKRSKSELELVYRTQTGPPPVSTLKKVSLSSFAKDLDRDKVKGYAFKNLADKLDREREEKQKKINEEVNAILTLDFNNEQAALKMPRAHMLPRHLQMYHPDNNRALVLDADQTVSYDTTQQLRQGKRFIKELAHNMDVQRKETSEMVVRAMNERVRDRMAEQQQEKLAL